MSFLPENYESPSTSNFYMKIQDGENRIRILSRPIIGWEDWQEKKPIRFKMEEKPAKSFDPQKPVRHFWAFLVYNYNDLRIQILQITQATIRSSIEGLSKDKDWGAPYEYDLKILRSGEGKETKYIVNPVPHKPMDASIIDLFYEHPCNLEALFTNEDPFAPHWEKYSKLGIHDKDEPKLTDISNKGNPINLTISQDQSNELIRILSTCDDEYVKTLWDSLKKQNITSVSQIPRNLFNRIKKAAINNQKRGENHIDNLFPINSSDQLALV